MKLFWMMVAGAFGVLCRYGFTVGVQGYLGHRGVRLFSITLIGPAFPLGTLLINVIGSFLLSFLTTLALQSAVRPDLRLIIGTGFIGAFTTFSTFEVEAESLLTRGQWGAAFGYIAGNMLLGFLAVIVGRLLALRYFGPIQGL